MLIPKKQKRVHIIWVRLATFVFDNTLIWVHTDGDAHNICYRCQWKACSPMIAFVWKQNIRTCPLIYCDRSWWRHQMETFSALLAICAENSPVPGEFSTQRPVTRSFHVYFDLRPNKGLSKQLWGWWFETQSCPLWRHRNDDGRQSHHTHKNIFLNENCWVWGNCQWMYYYIYMYHFEDCDSLFSTIIRVRWGLFIFHPFGPKAVFGKFHVNCLCFSRAVYNIIPQSDALYWELNLYCCDKKIKGLSHHLILVKFTCILVYLNMCIYYGVFGMYCKSTFLEVKLHVLRGF